MNILRVLTARDALGDTSKMTGFRPAGFAVTVVLSSSFVVATLANGIKVENLVPTPPESDKCDTKGGVLPRTLSYPDNGDVCYPLSKGG